MFNSYKTLLLRQCIMDRLARRKQRPVLLAIGLLGLVLVRTLLHRPDNGMAYPDKTRPSKP